jgi:hypothetical protein
MKTMIWILLILGFAVSCSDDLSPDNYGLGTEKDFKVGNDYRASDNALKFKIAEVTDSRCPTDVVCVWAGKADVKLNILSPITGTLLLNTFNNTSDTLGNYSFKLVKVLPYPVSTKQIKTEEYDITLKIEKLGK